MHAFDSSILVAALVTSERHHDQCRTLLASGSFGVWSHALVETFNTLTSGKIRPRPSAAQVAKVLRTSILPRASILHLPDALLFTHLDSTESRGVRGGAIFDYLHLATARENKAERFYTLNMSHFQSFWREGDPEIAHP